MPVLDRSGLILDIFAQRAKTKEGRLQVELAQYQYLLPRLAGIERVALGADFNSDVLLGGTGRKDVATSTANRGLFVIGMDTFLHVVHLFLIM